VKTKKLKQQIAQELKEKFQKAPLVILTNFQVMTVAETNELRRKLREAGAEYKVVKNTLMRYAYPGTPVEQIKDAFVGPTGIVFAFEDIVAAAKALKDYMAGDGKEEPKLKFKAAVVEGKVADFEMIKQLAELPSREELLGQLAFTLKYPVNAMAWSLENLFTKLVTVLENVKAEKEGAA